MAIADWIHTLTLCSTVGRRSLILKVRLARSESSTQDVSRKQY